MQKYLHIYLLLLCSVFLLGKVHAQDRNVFNLNINNGLPTNRVYSVMKDRNGYLWLPTEKGIVKYNGYEFKLFDLSNGLPNDDIWQLLEDSSGRIWVGNISDEIGFIKDDKYNRSALKNSNYTIYPQQLRNFGKGIIFVSPYLSGNSNQTICSDQNGKVEQAVVADSLFDDWRSPGGVPKVWTTVFIDEHGKPVILHGDYLYSVVSMSPALVLHKERHVDDSLLIFHHKPSQDFLMGNYIFSNAIDPKTTVFYSLNIKTGERELKDLKAYQQKAGIEYIYHNTSNISDSNIYVISTDAITQFEVKDAVRYVRSYSIRDLTNNGNLDGSEVTSLFKDSFWGNCICTSAEGLFINYNNEQHFIKDSLLGKRYKDVGACPDVADFWWDEQSATLLQRRENDIRYIRLPRLKATNGINKVLHYSSDTFIIKATGYRPMFIYGKGQIGEFAGDRISFSSNALLTDASRNSYTIDNFGFSLRRFFGKDTSVKVTFDPDRYRDLVYDSLRKTFWAYNYSKIFLHNAHYDSVLSRDKLSVFGIRKIEKIVIDNKFGNIFLKSFNNLVLYDWDHATRRNLYPDLNLKGATIVIYNNTLITAGRFGIVFSKITGPQTVSPPVVYSNIKNCYYSYVYGMHASWGYVWLSTDMGTYKIAIPSDSEMVHGTPGGVKHPYKFIVKNAGQTFGFSSGDTAIITQTDPKLQFDIINPYGNGKLRYLCKLSDTAEWIELPGSELNLPALPPDTYHRILISAYDNVWRSEAIVLNIYIQPYWWQTHSARKLMGAGIIVLITLLIIIAVLVTRRVVMNAADKRNLRMQMELKSIYAQINPHFIFNSLNSALLLVNDNKMEEAYAHISKFSKLLRGYLKSSRNTFISIDEEIANLRNYIELQQARFKNKFSHEIIVADKLDPTSVTIPSLLIQPFVENAINHGLLPAKTSGHLVISFNVNETGAEVYCTIQDNGIGRKQAQAMHENNKNKGGSYGDLLIKDLVSIFNRYEKMNISIKYTDLEAPLTGTLVTIEIKNPQYAK